MRASLARAEREGQAWLPVWWAGKRRAGDSPWGTPRAGAHRQAFLSHALADLGRRLRAMDSGLVVLRDPSPQALIDLARSVDAAGLVAEDIAAPEEQAEVAALRAAELSVQTVWQSSLLDPASHGSEAAALAHLRNCLARGLPHTYKVTRNRLTGIDFSSKWSPWLASGALSPRTALAALRDQAAAALEEPEG